VTALILYQGHNLQNDEYQNSSIYSPHHTVPPETMEPFAAILPRSNCGFDLQFHLRGPCWLSSTGQHLKFCRNRNKIDQSVALSTVNEVSWRSISIGYAWYSKEVAGEWLKKNVVLIGSQGRSKDQEKSDLVNWKVRSLIYCLLVTKDADNLWQWRHHYCQISNQRWYTYKCSNWSKKHLGNTFGDRLMTSSHSRVNFSQNVNIL